MQETHPDLKSHVVDSPTVNRALRQSIWDGVFANLYASFTGGIFLAGYALALQATEVQIGLFASLPLLANLAQPFSSYLLARLGRRRPLALASAAVARLSWLILLLLPLLPSMPALFGGSLSLSAPHQLLALSLILIGCSQIGTAVNNLVWLSWMADLVHETQRGRYFGRRNAALGAAALVATLAGGYGLDYWKARQPGGELTALYGLFGLGLGCGLISLLIQSRVHEPPLQESHLQQPFRQQIGQPWRDANFRRLLLFQLTWNFGVYLAAPFFAVYMLKTLELSYTSVATYATLSSLANLICARLWGRWADRTTNKATLLLASSVVACIPYGWLFTSSETLVLLAVLHLQGGACWAGINLSGGNLVLKLAPPEQRSIYIATFNAAASLMVVVASLLGGLALQYLPNVLRLYDVAWSPFGVIFFVSSTLRFLSLPLLAAVREPQQPSVWEAVPVLRNVRAFTTTMGFNPTYHFWLRGRRES